ncbi:DUF4351 domain-containing protein [Okeania sp. SIO3I5]|uniref:DUF4351 domain-containing protein n=1 Tax=Okeania sp. SIO3I5 TaxID=2607805 RepID=UPI0025DA68EA|nr:DUF4351 domain-containing protein [Okeania sp. SIO3I5]
MLLSLRSRYFPLRTIIKSQPGGRECGRCREIKILNQYLAQIEQLSLEKLDILGEKIFDLATIADLENWLTNQ